MRSNLSHYPHRLEKANIPYSFRFVTDPLEMGDAVGHLVRLHRHRSESKRGPQHIDHLQGHLNARIVRDCLTMLSDDGWACVALMEIQGEVVGAQAYLIYHGEFTFYYSGFDTAWYDYSPLTILTGEIIKRAISQKVDRINLLSHPSLFRVRWGSHTETRLYAAYVMRGHPHALAAMAQEKLGQLTGRIEY